MSFWDNVKKFAQPYADDEYDEYDEEELDEYLEEEEEEAAPAPAPRAQRAGRRTPNFGGNSESAPAPAFTPAPAVVSTPAPAITPMGASTGFSGQVVNNLHTGNKQEVVLFHAKAFDDAAKAANELRNRRAIILNMENVDKALTRRVVDFLSGCIYALDGQVKKIAQSTYLFCPHSIDIVGDLETIQNEVESYI